MAARNDSPSLATSASATALPVLDRAIMLASVEQDLELLRELVEIFLAEAPGLLAQIRAGVEENDAESVERAAHTLKGALGTFGALRAVEVAHLLEVCGRESRLNDAGTLIPPLELDMVEVCRALSEYLREIGR
jgi:two-component system sensor histidine kinase/response regulator